MTAPSPAPAPTPTPADQRGNLVKCLVVEAIGTMLLTLFIIVPASNTDAYQAPGLTGSALSGSLALIALVAFAIQASGAHFNPWLTLSAIISGSIPRKAGLAYIPAQIVGGLAAGLFAWMTLETPGSLGINAKFDPNVGFMQMTLVEFMSTFALVFCILMAANRDVSKALTSLAAGGILYGALIYCQPFTGGSLNLARSLGPALFSSTSMSFDVFGAILIGPGLAAVVAGLAVRYLKDTRPPAQAAQPAPPT